MDLNIQQMQAIGISQYGVIKSQQIIFSEEVRDICEKNSCRNYGTTWACPPAIGTLEACREKSLSFEHALVFNAVYPLEDSFDFEGMTQGHKMFKDVCDRLYSLVENQQTEFILLSNESCIRCNSCTYPDTPCRFSKNLYPSIEGYGILVANLAESANIKYINGQNTVTYFGMLLYDRNLQSSEKD